jgi:hypothetical protein
MNLHAILCWYDEHPTWLSETVASLSRIGVDHVIAVDGKYPHFLPGAETCSRVEQVDAITGAASAVGMRVTVHQPLVQMVEQEKRSLAFRLLTTLATPFEDWCVVIDADELVDTTVDMKRELAKLPADAHVVACRIYNACDPFAPPEGADNDVTAATRELHQKIPVDPVFRQAQSRFWRVLRDMRVANTHYGYVGTDAEGKTWYLRGELGSSKKWPHPATSVHQLERGAVIQHRKNHRTALRRQVKMDYYRLRDELGLERA